MNPTYSFEAAYSPPELFCDGNCGRSIEQKDDMQYVKLYVGDLVLNLHTMCLKKLGASILMFFQEYDMPEEVPGGVN